MQLTLKKTLAGASWLKIKIKKRMDFSSESSGSELNEWIVFKITSTGSVKVVDTFSLSTLLFLWTFVAN